jgi:Ca2+-binding EF-hand superfamily protein
MVSGISSPNSFSSTSSSEMMQQIFNTIDTNSDGSIDESEMSMLIKEAASGLIDIIFSKQDINEDNTASLIESNSDLAKLGQEMKNYDEISALSGTLLNAEKVFDSSDTNKDGVVSKDELSAVTGKNGDDIDELFGKIDTDCDGIISRTEDEAFQTEMTEQMQQNESADSGTTDISSIGMNWQNAIFEALLKVLTAVADSSNESTSIYA